MNRIAWINNGNDRMSISTLKFKSIHGMKLLPRGDKKIIVYNKTIYELWIMGLNLASDIYILLEMKLSVLKHLLIKL